MTHAYNGLLCSQSFQNKYMTINFKITEFLISYNTFKVKQWGYVIVEMFARRKLKMQNNLKLILQNYSDSRT